MSFTLIDLLFVGIYLALTLAVGLWSRNTKDSKGFFLADKNLPWHLLMLSIIATETSSLTFLNVPGISYKSDISFLQIAFGFIIGRIFVAYALLPLYFNNNYSSVYEWIGENFGKPTQKTFSAIFLITRILADGVRLYATSIPITLILQNVLPPGIPEMFTGILSLIIISVITIFYTVLGGFKAVVMTDVMQFFVYIAGGIFSLGYIFYLLPDNLEFHNIIMRSYTSGKLDFYHGFEGSFFKSPYFFINGILGGILISIGSHGVDQMFVQRLLACKSPREGRMALIGSGILVFFQFMLFLAIGILLFNFYNSSDIPQDKVFSKFIIEKMPTPALGLILAAILASAMSTLSSSINSMSLTVLVDWKKEKSAFPDDMKSPKFLSVLWGIILFISSLFPYLLPGSFSQGLVEVGLKIASFTFGPMIAIFLLGLKKEKHNFTPAALILSVFLSLVSTIICNLTFSPSLAFVIPMGILFFYLYIFSASYALALRTRA